MDLFKKAEKHLQPFNLNHYPQSVHRLVSVVRTNGKNVFKIIVEKFSKQQSHLKFDKRPQNLAILLRIKA